MTKSERDWGMACHLAALAGYVIPWFGWIIGPLVVWLMKREEYEYVDYHGKEAINFHISILIYAIIAGFLIFLVVGFILLPIIAIIQLVFSIIAAVKASRGEYYRYPLTIRFLK